jgi:hypothetical protein
MRKLLLASVVMIGLLVVFALPVGAAPKGFTYDVTCGDQSWVVTAKGTPGFAEGLQTPLLLLGGSFSVSEGGAVVDAWEVPPPPGLESRLMTCTIEGPNETDEFLFTVDPAYILPTG